MDAQERLVGCLIGTAVGDALGLCCEGLSRRRAARLYPHLDRYQLFAGRGLGSDDTDHAAITAWALMTSQELNDFTARLRHGLRRWFLALPAGIGWATLRSSLKMTMGLESSGVFSAGNGPVMRAPVLGVWSAQSDIDLRAWVTASTRLTHTDPKATEAAYQVALLTRRMCLGLESGELEVEDAYLREAWDDIRAHPEEDTPEFAQRRGWGHGVSGYVYHTVPVVLKACHRHGDDYRSAVTSVIRCGGDTDTTAAIVGGMVGARMGKAAIPAPWLEKHRDWPVSLAFLESLPHHPRLPSYPATVARNLLFGGAILGYGLRRLLPPY